MSDIRTAVLVNTLFRFGAGMFVAAAALGCSGDVEQTAPMDDILGSAEEGVTCVVLRRTAIAPTVVADSTIVFDPTDPTRAVANYGGTLTLNIGAQVTATRLSLVRFDLSSIPSNVPILSATLDLSVASATAVGTAQLYRVTAPWAEDAVTWNSFSSAYDSTVLGTFLPKSLPTNGHALIPLTSIVQAWNSGTSPNYGIMVDETSGARAQLGASEIGNAAIRPTLTVCYAPATCSDGLQNQSEGGIDCGGPCAPCYPHAGTEIVGAGTKSSSANYTIIYTLGQPTLNQEATTSASYRIQGGLIGADGP